MEQVDTFVWRVGDEGETKSYEIVVTKNSGCEFFLTNLRDAVGTEVVIKPLKSKFRAYLKRRGHRGAVKLYPLKDEKGKMLGGYNLGELVTRLAHIEAGCPSDYWYDTGVWVRK